MDDKKFIMNVGEHELSPEDVNKVNHVLSEFLETDVCLVSGQRPQVPGRTVNNDKNYCLMISTGRYVGVKRKHNEKTDFDKELFVFAIREIIQMLNYKVKVNYGFPMNGIKWRKGQYLLSDWGPIGTRIDLATISTSTLSDDDKSILLEQLGHNAALCCLLGLWDRAKRNFVWDNQEKKVISIDHEAVSMQILDEDILGEISRTILKFYPTSWYDDNDLNAKFSQAFCSTWTLIAQAKNNILEIYKKHGLTQSTKIFQKRLALEPTVPLGIILS